MHLPPFATGQPQGRAARRGAVLILVMVCLTFLSGIAVAFFRMSMAGQKAAMASGEKLRARYLAEGALRQALAVFEQGGRPALDALVFPQAFGTNSFTLTRVWGVDDAALADDLVLLTASATVARERVAIELIGRPALTAGSLMGVVGKNLLSFQDDALVDSYDSSAGDYASQSINPFGSTSYASTSAPVSSNGNIDLTGQSTIWGDAHPGTMGSVSVGGTAQVLGSTSPLAAAVAFPNISVPSLPSAGPLSESSTTQVIPAGDHHFDSLDVSGTGSIVLTGPGTIVVDALSVIDNASLSIDATGGPVKIYVTGALDVLDAGKIEPQNHDPSQLTILVSDVAPDVHIESTASVTGVLYAPDRSLFLSGSAQLLGSLVANDLTMSGSSAVHFDENLLSGAGIGDSTLEVVCWRLVQAP